MHPGFQSLVRAHQGAIRAFLRRLTGDAALADDLAQQAFMKAYTTQARMRETGSAKAWLFQIAYRTFLDEYRKNKRRADLFDRHVEEEPPQASPGLSSDISKAMDQLPDECRAVVMMVLAYGLTHEEAAKSAGLPLGTVKSHISRGKSKLRAFLAAYEVT